MEKVGRVLLAAAVPRALCRDQTAIRKGGGDELGTWYQFKSSNGWFNYF